MTRRRIAIAAQAGWFHVTHYLEDDRSFVVKDPIVAWIIQTDQDSDPDDFDDIYNLAVPVLASGAAPPRDLNYLLSPDGQVFEVEGASWVDENMWVKHMEREAAEENHS